ncbi:Strictosidine synthase family protein expressed [Hibiscus syriacus]|uniref:Strictosidine synthase family protein expressed n=1 Tax=Hibiscus syriacus TaxID=106335 RepID=A0A6A2ZPV6_HIBSY|nr:Strictosidine synthase family protein expressed [Hibiscus syriacus]
MIRFVKYSWTRLVPTTPRLLVSSVAQNYRHFSRFAGDVGYDDDLQHPGSWKSMEGLRRCSANYVPLSPISFLERAAKVYRDRTSLVYGSRKFTWSLTHQRCVKLASALSQLGISPG